MKKEGKRKTSEEIARLEGAVLYDILLRPLGVAFFRMEGVILEQAKKLKIENQDDAIQKVIKGNFSPPRQRFYSALFEVITEHVKEQFGEEGLKRFLKGVGHVENVWGK